MTDTTHSPASYPSPLRAWTVVGLLLFTAILAYTDRQVLSLLVDPIRADLHITDTQISFLLGTAFAVVYAVAGIPLGLLVDRAPRRWLIFGGVLLWSLATLYCGFAHNYHDLFAARMLVGLGEAVLSPAAISIISDYFPPEKRGRAVGVFLAGIAIGIGSSILIGGGVLQLVTSHALPLPNLAPWRLALIGIGAPGLIWCLMLLFIREPVRQHQQSAAQAATASELNWPRLILIYFVVAAASFADNAMGAWAPSVLIRGFGRDAASVGITLGLMLMLGFGGGVLAGGFLADNAAARWGARGKWAVCLLFSLLVLPVALSLNAPVYGVVLLAIPAYFACSGVVTACGFSAILDSCGNRRRGLAMAVSFFLNVALGAGFGPAAVSFAATNWHPLSAALSVTVLVTYFTAVVAAAVGIRMFTKSRGVVERPSFS